jgi:Protein of unknown function (DUF4229)
MDAAGRRPADGKDWRAGPARARTRLGGGMRPTLAYTALRLLLFIAALLLVYLLGARGFLLIGLAILISGIVSFVVLWRQREAVSGALFNSLRGLRQRLDEGTRAEDDD